MTHPQAEAETPMTLPRICATCLLLILFPGMAKAYVDPGSGSILFQVIIGGLLAAGVTLKFYWARFVAFFRGGKGTESDD